MSTAEQLNAHGLCVVRNACPAEVCSACHAEVLEACAALKALPMSIAERSRGSTHRVFLPVSVSPEFAPSATATAAAAARTTFFQHRKDFVLPITPVLRTVLRTVLSGEAGAAFSDALGDSCELTGLTFIVSEKGAAPQDVRDECAPLCVIGVC